MAAKADVQSHLGTRRDAIDSFMHEWANRRLSESDRADAVEQYFKEADLGETYRVGSGSSLHLPCSSFDTSRRSVLVVGRHAVTDLRERPEPSIVTTTMSGPGLASRIGPTIAFCEGVQAARELVDESPCNISFLSLGEDDTFASVGGPQLANGGQDVPLNAIIVTNAVAWTPQHPTLTTGSRGRITVRLSLDGGQPVDDYVTSGAVRNPLTSLTQILGHLRDERGRIALPGFYDRAQRPDGSAFASDDHDGDDWVHGLRRSQPNSGLSALERATLWPGASVLSIQSDAENGMTPGRVSALLAVYLVADQRPAEITASIKSWFEEQAPADSDPKTQVVDVARPYHAADDATIIEAQSRAAYRIFGRYPIAVRAGGPAGAGEIAFAAGVPVAFAGIAQPHAEFSTVDERLARSDFETGVSMAAETCLQLRRL